MKKFKLILKEIKKETSIVSSLIFNLEDNSNFDFEAGQYLNLFFPNDNNEHGKSYTISSIPGNEIRITVKKMGLFSGKLHDMKKGDEVYAMGPLGFMTLSEIENTKKDIVFIAGGVGITAFYPLITEVIEQNKKNNIKKNITLLYGVKKKEDIIFYKEFEEFKKKTKNFKTKYFLSKEKNNSNSLDDNFIYNRINIEDIKNNINLENSNFFICGTVEFVNNFWKELKNNNIKEEDIYTESFFIG